MTVVGLNTATSSLRRLKRAEAAVSPRSDAAIQLTGLLSMNHPASNRSLPWESGAEDARTPNASRLQASPNCAKRLECVRKTDAVQSIRATQADKTVEEMTLRSCRPATSRA